MFKRPKLLFALCGIIVALSVGAIFLKPALDSWKKSARIERGRPTTYDFEHLMGKELPTWSYVQTKEDFENLHLFKKIYDVNKQFLSTASPKSGRIPKVLHFIWLGPKPFPRESVENVRSWMGKHPDWKVKFWTDRERPTPCPGMEKTIIRNFPYPSLGECYQKCDNFGEKSDLLRYEILYNEGGVYVDHDVKCFKCFDPMNSAYDFYCGMDMPYKSSLPSCIHPTNNLLGAAPGHPIFKRTIERLCAEWDQIGHDYPGADRDALLNRVLHRTFLLFGESVKEHNNTQERRDIVFPSFFFDAPREEWAMWAFHYYSGKWSEEESKFEKMVRERLMIITKKENKLFLLIGILSALNLLGFLAVGLFLRNKMRST